MKYGCLPEFSMDELRIMIRYLVWSHWRLTSKYNVTGSCFSNSCNLREKILKMKWYKMLIFKQSR